MVELLAIKERGKRLVCCGPHVKPIEVSINLLHSFTAVSSLIACKGYSFKKKIVDPSCSKSHKGVLVLLVFKTSQFFFNGLVKCFKT